MEYILLLTCLLVHACLCDVLMKLCLVWTPVTVRVLEAAMIISRLLYHLILRLGLLPTSSMSQRRECGYSTRQPCLVEQQLPSQD